MQVVKRISNVISSVRETVAAKMESKPEAPDGVFAAIREGGAAFVEKCGGAAEQFKDALDRLPYPQKVLEVTRLGSAVLMVAEPNLSKRFRDVVDLHGLQTLQQNVQAKLCAHRGFSFSAPCPDTKELFTAISGTIQRAPADLTWRGAREIVKSLLAALTEGRDERSLNQFLASPTFSRRDSEHIRGLFAQLRRTCMEIAATS